MEILKHRKEIVLDEFGAFFCHEVRAKTLGMRQQGATEAEYFTAYAKAIFETYQNVMDVATIVGQRPTQLILAALELIELSEVKVCSSCEGSSITYTYVSESYEKSD